MAGARILISGEAIRIEGMSDFQYSKNGSILGFKYIETRYRHCVNKTKNISAGYYDYNKYLDFIASEQQIIPLDLIPINFSSFKATEGDWITVYQRNISQDFLKVCWYTYEFKHVEGKNYGQYQKIRIPDGVAPLPDSKACEHRYTSAEKFYNNYISKAASAKDVQFADLLADVQQMIEYLEVNIFESLTLDPNYAKCITSQRGLWENNVTYNFDSKQQYAKYLSRLSSFSLYFQSYKKKIGNDAILIFLYLTAIMGYEAIQDLPLDIKMKMLLRVALGDLDNWQIFFYNPDDDQSMVVKIVNSITLSQSDDFLSAMLNSDAYINELGGINLFEMFYVGLSKENLKNFIISMYTIWTQSSNNPYQNGVFNEGNFHKFTYNRLIATNPDPENSWWSTHLGLAKDTLNFSAIPVTINYTSSKFLGIYFDNFKFYFSKDINNTSTERSDFTYRFRFYRNKDSAPFGKILAVQDDYKNSGGEGLYGTYDYYQPVALVDSNQEAIMRIPVINGNNQATIEGHPEKINSLIPIFVLKYIDDAGDESDFYTSVGYFVDIASILFGGYGLVSKLKYLRTLSGFTTEIIAGSEYGSGVIVTLYATATTEAINLTAGTISFLLKLTGDTFKNEIWYKELTNALIWIEMLSAGGSVLSDRMLKIGTKKLVNEFNTLPNGWPEIFVTDVRGAQARQTLTEISRVTVDLLQPVEYRVRRILSELLTKEGAGAFSLKGANGFPLHTAEEISDIIKIAFVGGVPEHEIAELIHISYKIDKRIETSQLILQIKYYTYVTKVKGYSAGFISLEKYKDFCVDVNNFWKETFLDLSNIHGLNLKNVEYELMIQGSAVRKRLPTDPLPSNIPAIEFVGLDAPNDIEFAMLMKESDFNIFLDEMEKLVRGKFTGKNRQKLLENIKYGKRKGEFKYENFKYIEVNGRNILKELRSRGASHITGFSNPENDFLNFAIIKKGARLDFGPYIPFKYN